MTLNTRRVHTQKQSCRLWWGAALLMNNPSILSIFGYKMHFLLYLHMVILHCILLWPLWQNHIISNRIVFIVATGPVTLCLSCHLGIVICGPWQEPASSIQSSGLHACQGYISVAVSHPLLASCNLIVGLIAGCQHSVAPSGRVGMNIHRKKKVVKATGLSSLEALKAVDSLQILQWWSGCYLDDIYTSCTQDGPPSLQAVLTYRA